MSEPTKPRPSFAELVKQFQSGQIARQAFVLACANMGISLNVTAAFLRAQAKRDAA